MYEQNYIDFEFKKSVSIPFYLGNDFKTNITNLR